MVLAAPAGVHRHIAGVNQMAEERLVSVGDAAPGFRLAASTGGEIALADYLGQMQVALFFVRAYG